MGENMNGLKFFQVIVWVELAQNGKQVRTVGRGTITVIYECSAMEMCLFGQQSSSLAVILWVHV